MALQDNLVRLPGNGCRYYARGRCLYEEMLNPGFHASFACTFLERIDAHFEGFVERMERFQVDDSMAAMIWDRYGRKMVSREVCTNFVPHPQKNRGECLFRYDNACILRCPVCPGRCSRYQLGSNHAPQGGSFRR